MGPETNIYVCNIFRQERGAHRCSYSHLQGDSERSLKCCTAELEGLEMVAQAWNSCEEAAMSGMMKNDPQMLRLVAHDCGYPLSRYTCRATRVATDFLDFIAFCRCSTGVALHPLKILVSHLPPLCWEVSHRNLGLKRCRATRGCRSYSCGCRATLCN